MFTWKKDRANISDEEPTFHVRYLGCSETYVPVGPGCTSRHVQKLWDNAPSERHLKRVAVKLGLSGIWLKGVSVKGKSGESSEKQTLHQQSQSRGDLENEIKGGKEKGDKENKKKEDQKRKESYQNDEVDKKTKDKSNDSSSVTHFKMEDVSYCAADKSANDRIFCWISRCNRETLNGSEGQIGPLEVHAVLCSTVDKAQTMAAVMSRAFHLAYKDWRAEQQRETRKQQKKKLSDSASDGGTSDCRSTNLETDATVDVYYDERDQWAKGMTEDRDCSRSSTTASRQLSTSSSTSSLSSDMSQRSTASSKHRSELNKNCTCNNTEKRQDTLPRQEISTG